MWKIGSKRVQKTTRQCCKEISLGHLWKEHVRKQWKVIWTWRSSREWRDQNKVLWGINIQCENLIEARRPDLIVIDKKEHKRIIIDITVPADVRLEEKKKLKSTRIWKNR